MPLFARDYSIRHLTLPPSLPDLVRLAGLNKFKLKNDFKEVLGHPMLGYLSDYRLANAKRSCRNGKKSAFELEYSSVQHFSAAFKMKFGMSSTVLRER